MVGLCVRVHVCTYELYILYLSNVVVLLLQQRFWYFALTIPTKSLFVVRIIIVLCSNLGIPWNNNVDYFLAGKMEFSLRHK